MPALFVCPGLESLQAVFGAALTPEQREPYVQHLESCAACQEQLERAQTADDRLLRLVRKVGDTPAPTAPLLAQAMQRLQQRPAADPAALSALPDLYFLSPSEKPDLLGTLGSYEVQEVIGQGGMGVVLKAFDPALHRLVAIKVVAPVLAGSATARRRFCREAQTAAAVCHEHIVAVHGVHEADGLPYLVMQYVAGESLQARLDRQGPLEVEEVVRIGLQTASGLAAAHAQGLIHRDIKPANLLLENGPGGEWGGSGPPHNSSDRVRITDFGLARMADDAQLTQQGVLVGTPEYMAPEQARGEPVDHRADLFSLGSVLHALCTGHPPFRGETAVAVLRRVSDEEPAPVRSLNPDAPAWLEQLIARLLAKDPANRFQTAAEVASLLETALAHLRQPATVLAPVVPPSPLLTQAKERGRSVPFLTFVFLAALGLGMGLLALGFMGVGGEPNERARAVNDPGRPPEAGIDEQILALAFTPDGKKLVTAGARHTLPGQFMTWDVTTGKELVRIRGISGIRGLAMSPDGQTVACGVFGGIVMLRDVSTGQVRAEAIGHSIGVNGVAFSRDGGLLVSAGLDRVVKLWDVKDLQEKKSFPGHTDMVFSVAFLGDGRAFVSGGQDRSARIWDIATGKETFKLLGHAAPIEMVAVSPDDKIVATASWDRTIKFWDPVTGKELATLAGHNGAVFALAFSANGKLLASATDKGTVYLWDVETRKQVRTCQEHGAPVWSLAFSPDGKLLASGSSDKTARLWDVADARDVATLSASGAEATPDALPARAAAKGWFTAGGVVVLLIALSGFGVWCLVRRGPPPAQAPAQPTKDNAAAPGASPTVTVACPGCGRNLTVKAEFAGKKGKCPQCGRLVQVPESQRGASATVEEEREPAPPSKNVWRWGVLALLLLALLGGSLLLPQRPKKKALSLVSLTVGNEAVAGVEDSGFYNQQFAVNGHSFRWTNGNARLLIPIDRAKPPRALRVQLWPYRPANARQATVRILVNQHELFQQTLSRDRWDQTFDLTGMDLGDNVVVEILSDTFVPAEIKDAGPDTRALGVDVRGVTLLGPLQETNQ